MADEKTLFQISGVVTELYPFEDPATGRDNYADVGSDGRTVRLLIREFSDSDFKQLTIEQPPLNGGTDPWIIKTNSAKDQYKQEFYEFGDDYDTYLGAGKFLIEFQHDGPSEFAEVIVQVVEYRFKPDGTPVGTFPDDLKFVDLATDEKFVNVLAESPVHFNVDDSAKDKTSYATVRLAVANSYGAPAQVPPATVQRPVPFDEVKTRLEINGYDIVALGQQLNDLGKLERAQIIEFIAGDLVVDDQTPVKRPLVISGKETEKVLVKIDFAKPNEDDPSADKDKETKEQNLFKYVPQPALKQYHQSVDQLRKQYSIFVENVLRAYQVAGLVGGTLKEMGPFLLRIPLSPERIIELKINNPGLDGVLKPDGLSGQLLDEDDVESFVPHIYALLPNARTNMAPETALTVVMGSPAEQSQTILTDAIRDKLIVQINTSAVITARKNLLDARAQLQKSRDDLAAAEKKALLDGAVKKLDDAVSAAEEAIKQPKKNLTDAKKKVVAYAGSDPDEKKALLAAYKNARTALDQKKKKVVSAKDELQQKIETLVQKELNIVKAAELNVRNKSKALRTQVEDARKASNKDFESTVSEFLVWMAEFRSGVEKNDDWAVDRRTLHISEIQATAKWLTQNRQTFREWRKLEKEPREGLEWRALTFDIRESIPEISIVRDVPVVIGEGIPGRKVNGTITFAVSKTITGDEVTVAADGTWKFTFKAEDEFKKLEGGGRVQIRCIEEGDSHTVTQEAVGVIAVAGGVQNDLTKSNVRVPRRAGLGYLAQFLRGELTTPVELGDLPEGAEADSSIVRLKHFSDLELQSKITELLETKFGSTLADHLRNDWPIHLTLGASDVAATVCQFVEHMRSHVSYLPHSKSPSLLHLLLNEKWLANGFGDSYDKAPTGAKCSKSSLTVLRKGIVDRLGTHADLETLQSLDDKTLLCDLLTFALAELPIKNVVHDSPDCEKGGDVYWIIWPVEVRGKDACESAALFFDHIRKHFPSAATALVNVFSNNPKWKLPFFTKDADIDGQSGIEKQKNAFEAFIEEVLRASAGLSSEQAKVETIAKNVLTKIVTLSELWRLTEDYADLPHVRSEAIEYLSTELFSSLSKKETELAKTGVKDLLDSISKAVAGVKGKPAKSNGGLLGELVCCVEFARYRAGDQTGNPPVCRNLKSNVGNESVNHNDELVDCRPVPHLSMTGTGAYLKCLFERVNCDSLLAARPDIACLKISQANTEWLVPEIDLVNEQLERLVNSDLYPTKCKCGKGKAECCCYQTGCSQDYLQAIPQWSAPGIDRASVREKLNAVGATPFVGMLPYDQRLDAVRTTFGELGKTRYQLLKAFRKDISFHHLPYLIRTPDNDVLATEYLRFSLAEAQVLLNDQCLEGAKLLFGLADGTTPKDVSVKDFLRKTGMSIEQLKSLVAHQPKWLNLGDKDQFDNLVCDDLYAKHKIEIDCDRSVRLDQHLRLWRQFRSEAGGCVERQFCLLQRLVEGLCYFRGSDATSWQVHKEFLSELAAYKQLCERIQSAIQLQVENETCPTQREALKKLRHEWRFFGEASLKFLTDSVADQKSTLAKYIPLQGGAATSEENWTTLIDQLSCEQLILGDCCEDAACASSFDLQRIRQTLRLVDLAQTVSDSKATISELNYFFFGDPQHLDLPKKPEPVQSFSELNHDFRVLNDWRSIHQESLIGVGHTDVEKLCDLKLQICGLLQQIGFGERELCQSEKCCDDCTAGCFDDDWGAGCVPPAALIVERLDRVLSCKVEPEKQFCVAHSNSNLVPWCANNRIPDPFCLDDKYLRVYRSVTEGELIAAFRWVDAIPTSPDWDAIAKQSLKNKMAHLAELPLQDLRRLLPLLPNQREAAQKLIGLEQPPVADCPPNAPGTNLQKWAYVHRKLCELIESLTDHYACRLLDGSNRDGADRELIKDLIFGDNLTSFSDESFSVFNDDHPYYDEDDRILAIQLPCRPWRDLLLARGTGLQAALGEANTDNWFARRDGDIAFVTYGCEFNSATFNGWPEGWNYETPMLTRIPWNHCIPDPMSRGWFANWQGLLYLPEAVQPRTIAGPVSHAPTGQTLSIPAPADQTLLQAVDKVYLAINVAPLDCNNDNTASIVIRINGQPVPESWTPCHWIDGWAEQWESVPSVTTRTIMAFGPISAEDLPACDGTPDGMFDIELTMNDHAMGHGQAQFAMGVAIGDFECPPPAHEFKAVDTSRLFYASPVEENASACHPKNATKQTIQCQRYPKGWEYFEKSYERVWKSALYSLGLGLTKEEVGFFSEDQHKKTCFPGYDPTFADGLLASQTVVGFDLNKLFPNGSECDSRARFDQWERIYEYQRFRDGLAVRNGIDKIEQFDRLKTVFELAHNCNSSSPIDPADISTIACAVGRNSGDQLKMLKHSFKFACEKPSVGGKTQPDCYSVTWQDLKNHEWLRRIDRACDVLHEINTKLAAHRSENTITPVLRDDLICNVATRDLPDVAADLHKLFSNAVCTCTAASGTCDQCSKSKNADIPCVLEDINGHLRVRHRQAMLDWLSVNGPQDLETPLRNIESYLSHHLLMDVDCEPSRRITRVQSAIASIQRLLTQLKSKHTPNADFPDYETWVTNQWEKIYPENYVTVRKDCKKSLAFRQLERSLQKNEISLTFDPLSTSPVSASVACPISTLTTTNDNMSLRYLKENEQIERLGAELLERAVSRRELHAGWLTALPAPTGGDADIEGWQPGPNDLRAAVLLTIPAGTAHTPADVQSKLPSVNDMPHIVPQVDSPSNAPPHLSDKRHFLFWPLPTLDHHDDDLVKDYKRPSEQGVVDAEIKPRGAIRLGWAWKYDNSDYWYPSQLTDEWQAVEDLNNVVLAAVQVGDSIHVSCGSANGFVINDPALQSTSKLLALDKDRDKPVRIRFNPSGGYGGLLQIPSVLINASCPSNCMPVAAVADPDVECTTLDVCQVIAPPLVTSLATNIVNDCAPPSFGLSRAEKEKFVPLAIASRLIAMNDFDEANRWMQLAINPNEDSLKWCDTAGTADAARRHAAILAALEMVRDQSGRQLLEGTQSSSRNAMALIRLMENYLGPKPRIEYRTLTESCSGQPLRDIASDTASVCANTSAGNDLFQHPGLNPRLTSLWGWTESMVIAQRTLPPLLGAPNPNSFTDYFEAPSLLPHWDVPRSPYRFTFLIQKAIEVTNEVKGFGAQLLSALEKGDSEHLTYMRTNSEKQISMLTRNTRKVQWEEAETQYRVLKQNRFNTEFRKRYNEELIGGGLNSGERSHLDLLESAEELTLLAQAIELAAQVAALTPDAFVGMMSFSWVGGGQKISQMMNFISKAFHTVAGKLQSDASQALTRAGYERRHREWEHQRDTAKHEMTWLERQIDAAFQRMDIAKRELNSQQQQLEFSRRTFEFLRRKFTNSELYDWMQRELLALHNEAMLTAIEYAKQAENTLMMERHMEVPSFVRDIKRPTTMKESLLFGEQLHSTLRRMEKAYYDDNVRENELTKHFSLRLHSPTSLIALRATGICEFEVPEWMFDLEHPGHFMRRIKNVSISLPCVLGPYQTVNAKLTLVSSRIRVSDDVSTGYPPRMTSEGDPRFYRSEGIYEAISTTGAQNDSGMFEMNFKDERLLPFEGNGVISRWRIELPHESNWFDIETLTDAILHIRYTAKDGGKMLRDQARDHAFSELPSKQNPKTRIIDLQHDLPAEWEKLKGYGEHCGSGQGDAICLCLDRERFFPWHRKRKPTKIKYIDLVVQNCSATGIEFQTISYKVGQKPGTAEAVLIENCDTPNTFKARLDCLGNSELTKWEVTLPFEQRPRGIFFLVHYFYEQESDCR